MRKILMLDIEKVLIQDLVDDYTIVDFDAINSIIKRFNPDSIGIFSFAIGTAEDTKKYEYVFEFLSLYGTLKSIGV